MPTPPRSVSVPPHPADGLTLDVPVGCNGHTAIPDPRSFIGGGAEWIMRYGRIDQIADIRMTIASLLESYSHLLDGNVPVAEAVRQLRLMRSTWRAAIVSGQGERG